MKRVFALLLCLLLMPAALAEQYVVYRSKPEGYLVDAYLIRDDGCLVAGPEDYADIRQVLSAEDAGGPLYTVSQEQALSGEEQEGSYPHLALMDADGRLRTGYDFHGDIFANDNGKLLFYGNEGTMGILDPSGVMKVQGAYSCLVGVGEERCLALDANGGLLLLNADGKETPLGLTGDYLEQPNHPGDPVAFSCVEEFGGRSLYLDSEGQPLTEDTYDFCRVFEQGFAVVRPEPEGDYGLIDMSGTLVLPVEYSDIYIAGEGEDAWIVTEASDRQSMSIFNANDLTRRNTISFREIPGIDAAYVYPARSDMIDVSVFDENDTRIGQFYFDAYGRQILSELPVEIDLIPYCRQEDAPAERMVLDSTMIDGKQYLIDLSGNRYGAGWQRIDATLWKDGQGRFTVSSYNFTMDEEGMEDIDWSSWREGVIDENGTVILEPRYDSVTVLGLDRYWVEEDHCGSLVDGDGHRYFTVDDYALLMD